MTKFPRLIAALREATEALPWNTALRAHLNGLLMQQNRGESTPALRLILGGRSDDRVAAAG